jgi:putative membrane protein
MMMMGSGMLGMMAVLVLFWLLVIGAALWLLSRLFPATRQEHQATGRKRSGSDTALDVLMQRYARGEITKTEYEEIHRLLTRPVGE